MNKHLWYYYKSSLLGDKKVGPIDEDSLKSICATGSITKDTLVFSDTRTKGKWVKVEVIQALLNLVLQAAKERKQRRREAAIKNMEETGKVAAKAFTKLGAFLQDKKKIWDESREPQVREAQSKVNAIRVQQVSSIESESAISDMFFWESLRLDVPVRLRETFITPSESRVKLVHGVAIDVWYKRLIKDIEVVDLQRAKINGRTDYSAHSNIGESFDIKISKPLLMDALEKSLKKPRSETLRILVNSASGKGGDKAAMLPTDRQIEYAKNLGMRITADMSMAEASQAIDKGKAKQKKNRKLARENKESPATKRQLNDAKFLRIEYPDDVSREVLIKQIRQEIHRVNEQWEECEEWLAVSYKRGEKELVKVLGQASFEHSDAGVKLAGGPLLLKYDRTVMQEMVTEDESIDWFEIGLNGIVSIEKIAAPNWDDWNACVKSYKYLLKAAGKAR